jgi:hypothetical protein
MTGSDIVTRARITEVWAALGGGEIRRGRGRAFWRDGQRFNISLSDDKGAYFDHARGEGGGILDLVCLIQ